ncbi:hypothetical protein FQZ97_1224390 [compost metagenome]
MLSMKPRRGRAVSSRRSMRMRLPLFQVVIRTKRMTPAITGKAPPWKIFGTLALKNSTSTNRNPSSSGTASQRGTRQSSSMTAETSRVSISMVVVTATP